MNSEKRKTNYSQVFETLFWHALFFVAMWTWYRSILFRCFEKLTLTESRLLLLCFVMFGTLLGIAIDSLGSSIDGYTHSVVFHPLVNVPLGFGAYAALTYAKIRPILVISTISSSVVLAVIFSWLLVRRKVANPENKSEERNRRIHRVIRSVNSIMNMGFGAILVVIGLSVIFGGFLLKPTVVASKAVDTNEWTVSQKVDELSLFFDDEKWEEASLTAKLNVCQTLANICSADWGINELNVGTSNASNKIAAYYDDREHIILINVDYLMTAPGIYVCDTVAHEAYHALEHRMVDAYLAAPDDMKNLELYRDAAVYKIEFENYRKFEDGEYNEYSNQLCEKHARYWAYRVTLKIECAVKESSEDQNEENQSSLHFSSQA